MNMIRGMRIRKVLSTVLSGFVAVSLFAAAPSVLAETGGGDQSAAGVSWTVSKSKTATALDTNRQTTVTLSLPSAEIKTNTDIVFVMDKSYAPGTTLGNLKDAASNMLSELTQYTNLDVRVGVVLCNGDPAVAYDGLKHLSTDYDGIKQAMSTDRSGGSNLHGGLILAEQMLDNDSETDANHKYVITMTDGIVYYWNTDDGSGLRTVAYQEGTNSFSVSPSQEEFKASDSVPTFENLYNKKAGYSDDQWNQYDIDGRNTDGTLRRSGSLSDISTWVTEAERTSAPTCVEKGIYKAAHEYAKLAAKYHCINFYWEETGAPNFDKLGLDFMKWTGTVGDAYDVNMITDYSSVFKNIQDKVLYVLDHGTVTDPIDSHFSLVNGSDIPFAMTIAGNAVAGSDLGGGKYSFDNGNYLVSFDSASKQFVWDIKTPVTIASQVTLSYRLQLNDSVAPGTYPTNGTTVLNAISSTGKVTTENFTVPTVTYSIASAPAATDKPEGRSCQDDGYPAGYYWNGTACVIDTVPAATPTTAQTVPAARVPAATPTVTPAATAAPTPSATATAAASVTVSASPSASTTQPAYGREGGAWALLNLIMTIITMLLAIFELFAKKEKEEDPDEDEENIRYDEDGNVIPDTYKRKGWYKIVLAVAAILQIVLFILTENMRLPMIIWDKWTLLNIIITVITAVLYAFARRWKKQDEEDDDTAEQTH